MGRYDFDADGYAAKYGTANGVPQLDVSTLRPFLKSGLIAPDPAEAGLKETLTTPGPEGPGFPPSPAGVPVSPGSAPRGFPGPSDGPSAGIARAAPGYGSTSRICGARGVDVPGQAGRRSPDPAISGRRGHGDTPYALLPALKDRASALGGVW